MVQGKNTTLHRELQKKLGRTNILSLPRVDRVTVNIGVGRRVVAEGQKALEPLISDLARITGQKPSTRPARKAVASFKLREGLPAGLVVTLRGKRAEDFLTRLIRIALPRTRDFRGIPLGSIDSGGNLNIGIREQLIFPEATLHASGIVFGMQVTVVTTAKNRKEAEELFRVMGFPLQPSQSDGNQKS